MSLRSSSSETLHTDFSNLSRSHSRSLFVEEELQDQTLDDGELSDNNSAIINPRETEALHSTFATDGAPPSTSISTPERASQKSANCMVHFSSGGDNHTFDFCPAKSDSSHMSLAAALRILERSKIRSALGGIRIIVSRKDCATESDENPLRYLCERLKELFPECPWLIYDLHIDVERLFLPVMKVQTLVLLQSPENGARSELPEAESYPQGLERIFIREGMREPSFTCGNAACFYVPEGFDGSGPFFGRIVKELDEITKAIKDGNRLSN